ncbi:UBA/TS-N domain protein [Taphrina deformans PYCC 5710]|uniref:UBA/TS-N domain protein n=1 Tax=Taphrina deformans (strain PYCC 5710 / ATCC 11124 / CBS 356.35 / IMI 108563 / JCM 9778 / NBRC 8474) TaxID=1097556 RepID=R4X8T7_TAPDE|nr:UBA/TS-N domain protein [Taphrina deformans PYCC 5710]|eukprot:CCG80517.1 UBA/TS-N domain protein [Taphrina deformans PYCC 5710]
MSLLPEEKRYYGQLYKIADENGEGIINGSLAVKFFERSGLPAETLGVIWEISDKDNSGFLTQQSFSVALRLIGQAQSGRAPTAALAKQPGPYPVFQGVDPPTTTTSRSSAPQPPKSRNVVPPLTPEDRAKYFSSWQSVNPSGGMLEGERARDVFQKSRLPVEQLGQIWALTDTRNRGSLDATEFIVAMHLVQSMMNGTIKSLPSQLPPGVFESAANATSAGSSSRSQRQQSSISSVRSQEPLQQQFSGQRQPVPMRSQLTGPPGRNQPAAQMSPVRQNPTPQNQSQQMPSSAGEAEWDVKPHEKANYDNLFNDLDKSQKGHVTGEEAVGFFLQSKLPEEDLAKVWDLSDLEFSGQLTKETFAVAMHLIKGKLGGNELPAALPPSLIPPSMRPKLQVPVTAAYAKAQAAPQPVQPSSAAADLFDLNDSFSAPPTQPRSPPAQAFTSDNYASINRVASPSGSDFAPQRNLTAPQSAALPPRSFSGQAAFTPSSSFGQSIQQQPPQSNAGPPQLTPQPQAQQPSVQQMERDLLGDAEPGPSRSLSNDSTEIANLNNQMSSLNTQSRQIQQERGQVESDIANLQAQKTELNARLAQIRQAYDQEVQTVRAKQAEQGTLRSETRELIKEASLLEASLDAIRQQHETIDTQLSKDRTDNSTIKDRIKSANEQTVTLKATLEKVQKEAKQQRGLVAINTKQLNTLEAEHERLNAQIEQEQADAEKHRVLAIEQERKLANAEQSRSALKSPALSTTSVSTNPFHRISSPVVEKQRNPASSPFSQIFSQSNAPQEQNANSRSMSPVVSHADLPATDVAHQDQQVGSPVASSAPEFAHEGVTSSYQAGTGQQQEGTTTNSSLGGLASLSGFNHAFAQTGPTDERQSSTSDRVTDGQTHDSTATIQIPQSDTAGAPTLFNEPRANNGGDRGIVSPVPLSAQAHNWSGADPFTGDARVRSPSPQQISSKPPNQVASLNVPQHGSDDGSISTSVQAQAPASVRETQLESRPLTPASLRSNSRAGHREMQSATHEHELNKPVMPTDVQNTLTSPPHDHVTSTIESPGHERALSPQVPGAFPDEVNHRPLESSAATIASNDGLFTQSYQESHVIPQEHTTELESSDDETIEQPRGADFFSGMTTGQQSSSMHNTQNDDSSSTHTVTKEDSFEPPANTDNFAGPQQSFTSGANQAQQAQHSQGSSSQAQTQPKNEPDEFDEFDDLEEAAEVEDDELGNSFTTNTNDFDASFEPPSARSSFMPEQRNGMFATPTQIAPPQHQSVQESPVRDFSDFAHYGAVLGDDGLAPPISSSTVVNSPPLSFGAPHSASNHHDAQQTQASTQQRMTSPQAASIPPPPASRHGATLAPKRPEPARAISAADDPMLIELMDMGFQRDKSVSALEKFNYDLGAAMDYLLKGN